VLASISSYQRPSAIGGIAFPPAARLLLTGSRLAPGHRRAKADPAGHCLAVIPGKDHQFLPFCLPPRSRRFRDNTAIV
jgi:hypothetical protein